MFVNALLPGLSRSKGFSQEQLERATGIKHSTMSGYWSGRLRLGGQNAQKIADVLGIALSDLIGEPHGRQEMEGLVLELILRRLDALEASLEERGQIVADSLEKVTTLLEHLAAEGQLDTASTRAKAKD